MMVRAITALLCLLWGLTASGGEYSDRVSKAREQEKANRRKPLSSMSAADRRTWISADIQAAKVILAEFEADQDVEGCDEADLVVIAELYEKCFRFEKVSEIASKTLSKFPQSALARGLKFRAMLNLRQLKEADEFVADAEKELSVGQEPIPNAHSFLSMRYAVARNWTNVAKHSDRSLVQGLGQMERNPARLRQCVVDIGLLCRAPKGSKESPSECQHVLEKHARLLHEQLEVTASAVVSERSMATESALFEVFFELSAQRNDSSVSDVAGWWFECVDKRWSDEKFSGLALASATAVAKHSKILKKGSARLRNAITGLQKTAATKAQDGDKIAMHVSDTLSSLRTQLDR